MSALSPVCFFTPYLPLFSQKLQGIVQKPAMYLSTTILSLYLLSCASSTSTANIASHFRRSETNVAAQGGTTQRRIACHFNTSAGHLLTCPTESSGSTATLFNKARVMPRRRDSMAEEEAQKRGESAQHLALYTNRFGKASLAPGTLLCRQDPFT